MVLASTIGMWAGQIDAFAKEYRVLRLDLRGHGRSRPANEYSFDAVVDNCLAMLDVVKSQKESCCRSLDGRKRRSGDGSDTQVYFRVSFVPIARAIHWSRSSIGS